MNANRVKVFITAAAVSMLGISVARPVHAQDTLTKSKKHETATEQVAPAHPQRVSEQDLREKKVTKINKASSFIGMNVKNLQNQELGKVEDLAFNPDSGKIAYAVLSVGGFLGMNEKYIAVPLNALTPAPGENKLILDADKQRLQNAPGFAKNHWPDLDTPPWGAAAGFAKTTAPDTNSVSSSSNPSAVGHAGRSGQEQGSGTGKSDESHFSGTISSVDHSNHELTVKNSNGDEKKFSLDSNARVKAGKNENAKVEDLKVGAKVSVEYRPEGAKDVAKTIQEDPTSSSSSSSSDKKD